MKSAPNNLSAAALILCAGSGNRTGLSYNKILHYAGKTTLLEQTLQVFIKSEVSIIVLVLSPKDESAIKDIVLPYCAQKKILFCYGGKERSQSVQSGLKSLEGKCSIVVIHDGARPFVTAEIINSSIDSAKVHGSGIASVKCIDTMKKANEQLFVTQSIERDGLYNIQTPQTFNYQQISQAYANIGNNIYTDDSTVYAKAGFSPKLINGSYENIKVTTAADLYKLAPKQKIGLGQDVHALTEGLPLILGGVPVPHNKGLVGHSDADVLTHAIMDALLSAANLPDIGVLFPDNDNSFKGIRSILLLERVSKRLKEQHYSIGNISAVIMAQKPKLSPFVSQMKAELKSALQIEEHQINISCTTAEMLGIIGEEKGIAATAICLLYEGAKDEQI